MKRFSRDESSDGGERKREKGGSRQTPTLSCLHPFFFSFTSRAPWTCLLLWQLVWEPSLSLSLQHLNKIQAIYRESPATHEQNMHRTRVSHERARQNKTCRLHTCCAPTWARIWACTHTQEHTHTGTHTVMVFIILFVLFLLTLSVWSW